jgi:ribosome-associated protein
MLQPRRPPGRRFERIEALTTPNMNDAAPAPRPPAPGHKSPDADALVRNIQTSLEDSKAEDIVSIDLHGKTSLADLMVIATGRSNVHVGAIADRVVKACKEAGLAAPRVEGLPHCDWVLIDAGDVIVHVFRPEVRQFYNLEKMWSGDRPAETARRVV